MAKPAKYKTSSTTQLKDTDKNKNKNGFEICRMPDICQMCVGFTVGNGNGGGKSAKNKVNDLNRNSCQQKGLLISSDIKMHLQ